MTDRSTTSIDKLSEQSICRSTEYDRLRFVWVGFCPLNPPIWGTLRSTPRSISVTHLWRKASPSLSLSLNPLLLLKVPQNGGFRGRKISATPDRLTNRDRSIQKSYLQHSSELL
ncbi:MAG: hypothetical protein KME10_21105 [Plectolyngbya sp. WJT66-NPBG17]|nr:hypothetical protein [Plectolyngbya sp. WJT66-NPBG17]